MSADETVETRVEWGVRFVLKSTGRVAHTPAASRSDAARWLSRYRDNGYEASLVRRTISQWVTS